MLFLFSAQIDPMDQLGGQRIGFLVFSLRKGETCFLALPPGPTGSLMASAFLLHSALS